jgi:uncharacterized protein YecT (DUF1311 family)
MKRLIATIAVVSGVIAAQMSAADEAVVTLATAPNNEYALEWATPSGPLRIVASKTPGTKAELDVSQLGRRFGAETNAMPLPFISPDSNWVFIGTPADPYADAPASFNQPGVLFHWVQENFEQPIQGRFDTAAWEFIARELNLKQDLADGGQRVSSVEFVNWSADSARLLVKIGSGGWSPSKKEWVASVQHWYCYFNTRSGKFELTQRLRSIDSNPALNGIQEDDPHMLTVATTAEPVGGEGPQQPRKENFENADKRLNEVYTKLLAKTEPSKRESLREEQRAWLLTRDSEAELIALELWSPAREASARIVESKTASTQARVAELEKRL